MWFANEWTQCQPARRRRIKHRAKRTGLQRRLRNLTVPELNGCAARPSFAPVRNSDQHMISARIQSCGNVVVPASATLFYLAASAFGCALEVLPNLFTRGRLIREKRLFRHKGKAHIQTFPSHLVEQKAGTTTEAETANRVPPAPFPVGIRVLHVRQRLLLGFLLGHKGLALFNSVLR